jgi:hypothetical protein
VKWQWTKYYIANLIFVSGINHGANHSINVIYSGTMSAAMEAAIESIPSVGFSLLDFSIEADFEGARKYARIITEKMLQSKLDKHSSKCKCACSAGIIIKGYENLPAGLLNMRKILLTEKTFTAAITIGLQVSL